jgi:hypothetical protein
MATVPKIERINTSPAMPKNDRINFQAQDNSDIITNRVNTVVGLADKVGDLYQKYENDKIDNIAAQNEADYSKWNNQRLQQLKNYQGDPTEAYAQYEKERDEKYNEIIGGLENASDRVKRHVSSRLNGVVARQNVSAMNQRGAQQETYDNNMYESQLKLRKDGLSVNAGYIKSGDKSSYFMFEEGLHDIKTTIAKRGIKKGTATELDPDAKSWDHIYKDDDGKIVKVKFSDVAKVRAAKETSEGIKNSIDVMIAGGQTAEAAEMKERYAAFLDPSSASKIQNKLDKSNRKQDAYKVLGTLRNKPEAVQIEEIEKISDPELRSQVIKIKDADDAKMSNMRERKDKKNYEALAKVVIERQNSDTPFFGMAELEEDPLFKQTWDNMSAKSQVGIREMVETPKASSEKSLIKVNSFLLGESDQKIEDVSVEEFYREYLPGLSKGERSRAITRFNRLKDPTAAQERSMVKRANEVLKSKLIMSGYVKKDYMGRFAGGSEKRLYEAQSKLGAYLSETSTIPSEQGLNELVNKFVAEEIEGEVFRPSKPVKKDISASPEKTKAPVTTNIVSSLSPLDKVNLKTEFKRVNGFTPLDKDPRFEDFVKKKRG